VVKSGSGWLVWLGLVFIQAAFAQYNILTFHGDPQRTGWISRETLLTPANVSGGAFGPIWNSPQLDSLTVNGVTYPPHLYASPLYVDAVNIRGARRQVVYAGVSPVPRVRSETGTSSQRRSAEG
jgi:hypothetical protein